MFRKFDILTTEKLLSSQIMARHARNSSQINNPQMRNLDRIFSQSRSNSRGNALKRKSSLKGISKNKSKVNKLQMSYISPMQDSRDSSIK